MSDECPEDGRLEHSDRPLLRVSTSLPSIASSPNSKLSLPIPAHSAPPQVQYPTWARRAATEQTPERLSLSISLPSTQARKRTQQKRTPIHRSTSATTPSTQSYGLLVPPPILFETLHSEQAYLLDSLARQNLEATDFLRRIQFLEEQLSLGVPHLRRKQKKEQGWMKRRFHEACQQEKAILARLGQLAYDIRAQERWNSIERERRLQECWSYALGMYYKPRAQQMNAVPLPLDPKNPVFSPGGEFPFPYSPEQPAIWPHWHTHPQEPLQWRWQIAHPDSLSTNCSQMSISPPLDPSTLRGCHATINKLQDLEFGDLEIAHKSPKRITPPTILPTEREPTKRCIDSINARRVLVEDTVAAELEFGVTTPLSPLSPLQSPSSQRPASMDGPIVIGIGGEATPESGHEIRRHTFPSLSDLKQVWTLTEHDVKITEGAVEVLHSSGDKEVRDHNSKDADYLIKMVGGLD